MEINYMTKIFFLVGLLLVLPITPVKADYLSGMLYGMALSDDSSKSKHPQPFKRIEILPDGSKIQKVREVFSRDKINVTPNGDFLVCSGKYKTYSGNTRCREPVPNSWISSFLGTMRDGSETPLLVYLKKLNNPLSIELTAVEEHTQHIVVDYTLSSDNLTLQEK